MRTAKKPIDNIKILQELVPLNALSEARFNQIAEKIVIEVYRSGRYLFRKDDRDNRSIYLLEGKVNLLDGDREVTGEIVAGTDAARHPIVNQQPRPVSARVVEKAVIAHIDAGLLDVLLTLDQSNMAELVDLDADDTGDWMTRLLQEEPFSKLPPSKLQGLLLKMKPYPVKKGDVVITQGEDGDYFYTIHEGRCKVTRQRKKSLKEEVLAELSDGESFGEEALVSDAQRNASVTMLTDGQLMRLAKDDFDELLKTSLLKYVDHDTATQMVTEGAVWLDVRTSDEYESGSFEDSVNLPLASLRGEITELVFNSRYVICCDTGRRSDSAAFILSHKGFEIYVLEGGMSGLLSTWQSQAGENHGTPAEAEATDSAAAGLREKIAALQEINKSLTAERDEQQRSDERMSRQIEQLRGELGESAEKLGELDARVNSHAGEKQKLLDQNAALQQAHAAELQSLEQTWSLEKEKVAALQTEASSASTEHKAVSGKASKAAQSLAAEKQQLAEQLAGAQERIAGLEADLQVAVESGSAAQAEVSAELQAQREKNEQMAQQAKALEDGAAGRQGELDSALRSGEDRQQEHEKQIEALNESLQQLNSELAAANKTTEQLQDENRQLLSGQETAETHLGEQAERQQAADERLGELQTQRAAEQQRADATVQQGEEKDRQIATLQQESAADLEARQLLDEEVGLLRQQMDDALELLQQREEQAQALESEYAESFSKSHDELILKNDMEKELQGQIDRLRKKLEQVSAETRKSRESAHDDLDNLRGELHHERQARAEERAQMAARQRELKEQLAAIAVEHEANITNQSGAIEQAQDVAREEERSRLQGMLDSQSEAEEQLARMQEELRQAHEEIAVLDQQEKARRQAEIDAMQEQNEQAEAAITQLEKQLKKLTRERDNTLEDQHELRVKMNALRGEVEVARGLMTGGKGRLEDQEQLRGELDETRKNVKIAVRLRAEAEATREKMAAEVQRLRALYVDPDNGQPLHVPLLDEFDLDTGASTSKPVSVAKVAVGSGKGKQAGRRRLAAVSGMLMTAILVLVTWRMVGMDMPLPGSWNAVDIAMDGGDVAVVNQSPRIVAVENSATETVLQDALPLSQPVVPVSPEPAPVEAPVADAMPEPELAFVVPQPPHPEQAPTKPDQLPAAVVTAPVVMPPPEIEPPVGNTYRDVLKDGGKGPSMVELDAASYQMGSIGNSLNFDEGPRHWVTLGKLSISKHEVSFAEYDRFARATGQRLPYDETWGRGKHPVINVSWHDAVAYTRWLSAQTGEQYRLSSEAEWEYAARAGSKHSYWWVDIGDGIHANCFDCGSKWDGKQTAPVGSFAANRYGLFDMTGNVQEWTADCYQGNYNNTPTDGGVWDMPACAQRVVRGGAYSSPQDSLRSAKRAQLNQDTRLDNLGFRVVRVD